MPKDRDAGEGGCGGEARGQAKGTRLKRPEGPRAKGPGPPALPPVPAEEVEERFDRDEAILAPLMSPVVDYINGILERYGNATHGSFESDHAAAERINQLADRFGLVLLYDGKPVRLRCHRVAGSNACRIEARIAGAGGGRAWSAMVFPPLKAQFRLPPSTQARRHGPMQGDRHRRKFLEHRAKVAPGRLAPYAGRWIAWSPDGTRIVADSELPEHLDDRIRAAGENPELCVVEGVPAGDGILGGEGLGTAAP